MQRFLLRETIAGQPFKRVVCFDDFQRFQRNQHNRLMRLIHQSPVTRFAKPQFRFRLPPLAFAQDDGGREKADHQAADASHAQKDVSPLAMLRKRRLCFKPYLHDQRDNPAATDS